jgi:hypothetical protein
LKAVLSSVKPSDEEDDHERAGADSQDWRHG